MSNWYGSITNRLQAMSKSEKPVVGMGVTELLWSDRYPFEVIEVTDDTHILIRALRAIRTDDNGPFTECQEYRYETRLDGEVKPLVFRNGKWRECEWDIKYKMDEAGNLAKDENGNLIEVSRKPSRRLVKGNQWHVGTAEYYRDPSF